jgi:AraC-like DNA-binding protein
MTHPNVFTVNPGWRIVLLDAGLNPTNVLRRAGLPDDLFGREKETLSSEKYFDLWRAIEAEADDPTVSLRLGSSVTMESFDPPIFAAEISYLLGYEDPNSFFRAFSSWTGETPEQARASMVAPN